WHSRRPRPSGPTASSCDAERKRRARSATNRGFSGRLKTDTCPVLCRQSSRPSPHLTCLVAENQSKRSRAISSNWFTCHLRSVLLIVNDLDQTAALFQYRGANR